jgi:hypothetical protein
MVAVYAVLSDLEDRAAMMAVEVSAEDVALVRRA